jgi:hypothetical protein
MVVGVVVSALLISGPLHIGATTFDVHTLLFSSGVALIGFQFVLFYGLTKVFTVENGLLPKSNKYDNLFRSITMEKGLILGFLLMLVGVILSINAYTNWQEINFGDITNNGILRIVIPAVTTMILGVQVILFSLFFSILGLKK